MKTIVRVCFVIGISALAAIDPVLAVSTTWNGSGDWTDGGNWSGGMPSNGCEAVLASGTCVLSAASADLSSLDINGGAVLVFSNWDTTLHATNVSVNNGKITCAGPFNSYTNSFWPTLDSSNRVAIACSNLTVATGAAIDVTGKGYRGGWYVVPSIYHLGHGPGGGDRMVGASHGAYGGYSLSALAKAPYGDPLHPTAPGSGGGCDYFVGGESPGHGGGAIEILASGVITVNGAIRANGIGNAGGRNGGGSGGSLYLSCARLAGTGGSLSAEGGNTVLTGGGGQQGGSGSGGRIAVLYEPALQAAWPVPDVTLSALSRISVYRAYAAKQNGDLGTLVVPDDRLFAFTHSGVWLATNPSINAISVDSLSLTTSNNWLRIPRDPFTLTVTNALSLCNGARLDLTNATVSCGSLTLTNSGILELSRTLNAGPALTIAGAGLLTNGSFLALYSGPTNGALPYGTRVQAQSLDIQTGSWIIPDSHPTNGGSVKFEVGSLTVGTNSGIDAAYRGFDVKDIKGYGPGGGIMSGTKKSGAGYGGMGGDSPSHSVTGGLFYGNSNAPVEPGSAAAYLTYSGAGGGLIWIETAGDVSLKGTLNANGQSAPNQYGAAGSGGGIYVRCKRFGGNGTMTATGGTGGSNATLGGGGGGGGRIAVVRKTDLNNTVSTQVAGGAATPGFPGEAGTAVWLWAQPRGTVISIR